MAQHQQTQNISASPLCWPHWISRTPQHKRKAAKFSTKDSRGYGNKPITIAEGTKRVIEQIRAYTPTAHRWRSDPDDLIISTNLLLRIDGLPRSNQSEPSDPGVAVYFQLDGEPRVVPCDNYDRVADNLAGAAATLQALRTIERHGSNMFEAAFTGFTGLPSPDQVTATTWREVLGYYGNNLAEAKKQYRRAASKAHPDNGGSNDAIHQVTIAWSQAQESLAQQSGHQ